MLVQKRWMCEDFLKCVVDGEFKKDYRKFENHVIISAFTGIGKTQTAKKYPNECIDLDVIEHHFRQQQNMNDDDFYEAYTPKLYEAMRKYKYIFVSCSKQMLTLLNNLGLKHIKVVPKFKSRHLMNMKIFRFPEKDHIKWLEENWDEAVKWCKLYRVETTAAVLELNSVEDILFTPGLHSCKNNTPSVSSFPLKFNANIPHNINE